MGASTDNAGTMIATQIIVGGKEACMINPPIGRTETALALLTPVLTPVLATVAGKLLDAGANALADYINDAAINDARSISVVTKSGYFYRLRKILKKWTVEPALQCIAIVRGPTGIFDLDKIKNTASKRDPRSIFQQHTETNEIDFPALRKLNLTEFPQVYLEFIIDRDALNTAFRLKPTVIYRRPTDGGEPSVANKELNLALAFYYPSDASPFAIIPVRIP